MARLVLRLVGVIGFIAAAFWIWTLRENVHVVVPGAVYRSAQLSPARLAYWMDKYQIRTVINLRGPHPASDWYQAEIQLVAGEKQAALHDLPLQAYSQPSPENWKRLQHILDYAERPLWVHCEWGADRTGLVSALAVLWETGDWTQAHRQISWRYGVFHHRTVGRLVFQQYEQWLQKAQKLPDRHSFQDWLALHTHFQPTPL